METEDAWRPRRRRRSRSKGSWARPQDALQRERMNRVIATTDGHVGRRCASALVGTPHYRYHAHQHHHHGLQGRRGTRSVSHLVPSGHSQWLIIKRAGRSLADRVVFKMFRRARRKRTFTQHRRQRGGLSPGLVVGIGKAAFGITKALGSINRKTPKRFTNVEWPRSGVVYAKDTRANRPIALSCKGPLIKGNHRSRKRFSGPFCVAY